MNDDDFMDLLSSDGPGPQGQAQEDAPDLLGSLLGGGGAGGLGGLLGSLMGSDAGDPNEGTGVGDMAEILEAERVGVALNAFDDASLRSGLERLIELTRDPDIRARCVAAARRHFSLDEGVARYRAVYRSLGIA